MGLIPATGCIAVLVNTFLLPRALLQIEGLNSLLDYNECRYMGRPVRDDVVIVCLVSMSAVVDELFTAPFYDRLQHIVRAAPPLHTPDPLQSACVLSVAAAAITWLPDGGARVWGPAPLTLPATHILELHHSEDWRAELVGTLSLGPDGKPQVRPGLLPRVLATTSARAAADSIMLKNVPEAGLSYLREVLQTRCISFNGAAHLLPPAPAFRIVIAEGYAERELAHAHATHAVSRFDADAAARRGAPGPPAGCAVVNYESFATLWQRCTIDSGAVRLLPGPLAQAPEGAEGQQPFTLRITTPLPSYHWCQLLLSPRPLRLWLDPGVTLPPLFAPLQPPDPPTAPADADRAPWALDQVTAWLADPQTRGRALTLRTPDPAFLAAQVAGAHVYHMPTGALPGHVLEDLDVVWAPGAPPHYTCVPAAMLGHLLHGATVLLLGLHRAPAIQTALHALLHAAPAVQLLGSYPGSISGRVLVVLPEGANLNIRTALRCVPAPLLQVMPAALPCALPDIEGVLDAMRAQCVYWGDFGDLPTYSTFKYMCFQAAKGITTSQTGLCPLTADSHCASCTLGSLRTWQSPTA